MRTYSLLLSLFFLTPMLGQQKPTVFKSGELLRYKMSYSGFLRAGTAVLELKEKDFNGKKVFYTKGSGWTSGAVKWFFEVDDHYESYFDKDTIKPYLFKRKINEGGYKKEIQIDFNQSSKMATIVDFINDNEKIVPFPSQAQDMVSSFYYLRNNLDTHSLKENDEFDLDMFFDSENYKFKLKYLRKEVLDTEFGKVPCLVFRPYVESGRVFNEKESLTIWVSDDDNKIPLLIKADLAVGSLKASLIEFKKLNNSFKIFVK